jgi:predicted acetylornithine/succinylornithine family transaminase
MLPVEETPCAGSPAETLDEIIELDRNGAIQLFKRYPVAFVRGQGSLLWDTDGKEYVDFLMGIAVCGLGHCHPAVVKVLQDQAATLMHTSNLFYIPAQAKLADRLRQLSRGFLSYFANSGAEANECAIKLARKYGHSRGGGRFEIITALNSFHGRTLATIAATGQEKVKQGFDPIPAGFRHVPFNDLPALEQAVTPQTTAVMLEVIQAESYNTMPDTTYLQGVRRMCNERGILLIFDEVQTGIGRSGEMFAWQHFGVQPDIFTLAKALGSGFPISACLARPEVASAFAPGDHGGTYGGNALACAVGLAVLDAIETEDVLESVRASSLLFLDRLHKMAGQLDIIEDVRGIGLLLAVELNKPLAREVSAEALKRGLVLNATSDRVLRLRPALNIQPTDINRGLALMEDAIRFVASAEGRRTEQQ